MALHRQVLLNPTHFMITLNSAIVLIWPACDLVVMITPLTGELVKCKINAFCDQVEKESLRRKATPNAV